MSNKQYLPISEGKGYIRARTHNIYIYFFSGITRHLNSANILLSLRISQSMEKLPMRVTETIFRSGFMQKILMDLSFIASLFILGDSLKIAAPDIHAGFVTGE